MPATPTISHDGSPIVQKITITGIVPTMRLIYVDPGQHILRVVGNTDQNITPQVILAGANEKLAISPYINEQYQLILATHGGKLEAGKTYYPAAPHFSPITTSTRTAGSKTTLNLSALKLSFS